VVSPTCGDTRTEKDFANHIKGTIDCDPEATRWHIVVDGLKTRLLEFIDHFNRTIAKPFKWTYRGKVLAA
jgi:hypothetical protein